MFIIEIISVIFVACFIALAASIGARLLLTMVGSIVSFACSLFGKKVCLFSEKKVLELSERGGRAVGSIYGGISVLAILARVLTPVIAIALSAIKGSGQQS